MIEGLCPFLMELEGMAQSTILLALPGAQKQRCATLEPRFDTIIKCLYHEKDQERPETHDHIG